MNEHVKKMTENNPSSFAHWVYGKWRLVACYLFVQWKGLMLKSFMSSKVLVGHIQKLVTKDFRGPQTGQNN